MNPSRFRLCAVGLFVTAALLASAAVGTANAAGTALPTLWPPCVPRSGPILLGATEAGRVNLDARLQDITLHSQAMHADVHVDVLVPTGYDPSSGTRYPVLYLLHGATGSYRDWPAHGVEGFMGNTPMIVVLPDDGPDGSYSDWYGSELIELGQPPAWESFHIGELVPWIDAHYPTIAAPGGRFIAGLSSGGGGAMKYASAHPGLFGAAGEFSGAVDTDLPGFSGTASLIWDLSYLPGGGPPAHCTWGDPATQEVVWRDNDPTYLASNLAGTRLFLASGTGQPGPLDPPLALPDAVESTVWSMNQAFDAALSAAGIGHTTDFYGPGTHTWPYWTRELQRFLTWLAPTVGVPVGAPGGFALRSARPSFGAWDWTFTAHRNVEEFAYLTGVGPGGLTATGSGALDVTTAAVYHPGATYAVAVGATKRSTGAGPDGRLRFTVDLGPSHLQQQTDFGPGATAGWTTVTVSITG
jgi:S-formylglutathione hydrolase FrmB